MDAERVPPAVLIGNSLGGHVALDLALQRRSVSAASCSPDPRGSSSGASRAVCRLAPRRLRAQKMNEVFHNRRHGDAGVGRGDPGPLTPRSYGMRVLRLARSAKRNNLEDGSEIRCPTLLVWGNGDQSRRPPHRAIRLLDIPSPRLASCPSAAMRRCWSTRRPSRTWCEPRTSYRAGAVSGDERHWVAQLLGNWLARRLASWSRRRDPRHPGGRDSAGHGRPRFRDTVGSGPRVRRDPEVGDYQAGVPLNLSRLQAPRRSGGCTAGVDVPGPGRPPSSARRRGPRPGQDNPRHERRARMHRQVVGCSLRAPPSGRAERLKGACCFSGGTTPITPSGRHAESAICPAWPCDGFPRSWGRYSPGPEIAAIPGWAEGLPAIAGERATRISGCLGDAVLDVGPVRAGAPGDRRQCCSGTVGQR